MSATDAHTVIVHATGAIIELVHTNGFIFELRDDIKMERSLFLYTSKVLLVFELFWIQNKYRVDTNAKTYFSSQLQKQPGSLIIENWLGDIFTNLKVTIPVARNIFQHVVTNKYHGESLRQ